MDRTVSFSVANINPGTVRAEFMLSMMQLVEKERALGELLDPALPRVRFDKFYAQYSGPYLDDSRNRCVQWFHNDTESDYLVFIDSDIAFDANKVFSLVEVAAEHGVTILSGVYYNQFGKDLRALIYEWGDPALSGMNRNYLDDDARDLIPLANIQLSALYPQDKPHPVDACGAGFFAIHRKVFIDMAAQYAVPQQFFAELCLGGIHMGEDLTFCVRAKAVGHQTYVFPSIEVDHYKTCVIRSPHRIEGN